MPTQDRDMIRKAEVHLELNLARVAKGNKSLYSYVGDRRRAWENVSLLLNGAQDMEKKAEILNVLFDSDLCETIKFRTVIFHLQ